MGKTMEQQLLFLERPLNRDTRRRVEKILSSYRSLGAIIESLEVDLPETKMTVSYESSESQRSNQFSSQTEKIAMARVKIDEHKRTKSKLERIYKSLRPVQKEIWDKRYIEGKYDEFVFDEIGLSERNYYRLKRELLLVVAEAFCLI